MMEVCGQDKRKKEGVRENVRRIQEMVMRERVGGREIGSGDEWCPATEVIWWCGELREERRSAISERGSCRREQVWASGGWPKAEHSRRAASPRHRLHLWGC
ncbi:hypothetical protein AGABI2DRAFT_193931 [Agaricus bisporus var. bisporus H97]|uniref:hypothetical protein n=1 Tax=Agaricus bisporus var. bisporus (strain H97 / ATCC MYA-4626 / FGSC 10389) TaxID=936046 RepID=UPI00029F79FF|nr:hypothetical protein AGABI2DRAFT_193931 [Agaricus bisporus var. bisporus H97]EKV46030.1 hypothetical protein AGABI2DRAFT_193931 [Agaricus bisporus var. bisporus H97]